MPARKARRAALDRDAVVDAAFAVLDEHGLDQLTVRRIAARLGVENPALYWHFDGKQALLDAMAARMLAASVVERHPRERWEAWLARWARGFRAAMRAHRDGARVVATADLTASPLLAAQERALAALVAEGFAARDAAVALVALGDYVLGATFEEEADPARAAPPAAGTAPRVSAVAQALAGLDADAVFARGLGLLLDGLAARLRRRSDPRIEHGARTAGYGRRRR